MSDEQKFRSPLSLLRFETRTKSDGGSVLKIKGHAAVFNKLSHNLGGFVEQIAPGAFKKAIKKSDVRALINHDSSLILGRVKAGTLMLKEDDVGLYMEVDPPNTSYARDLLESIDRGDIDEQSFGFTVKSDKWEGLDTDKPKRTILEVDELFDVGPVSFGAYSDTDVAVRTLEKAKAAHQGSETTGPDEGDETISDEENVRLTRKYLKKLR